MEKILSKLIDSITDWKGTKAAWKTLSIILLIGICIAAVTIFLFFNTISQNVEDVKKDNKSLQSTIETINKENADLRFKFDSLGVTTEVAIPGSHNAIEFAKNWNTSDFYLKDGDTFCPKTKGKNNYQRMFYKNDSPLAGSNLNIKIIMVNESTSDYEQRFVIGLSTAGIPIAEYDFPTRLEQVVNYRVQSGAKGLVSGGIGKSLSSTMKEGSKASISFRTQPKHGQDITSIFDVQYISAVDAYGAESDSVANDFKIDNDPKPNASRGYLFIGSYMGGCIKIVDWSAS